MNNNPSKRQLSIASAINQVISGIFTKNELYHPDLDGEIISFPIVRVTPDLKMATVYTNCLNKERLPNILKVIVSMVPAIKKIIAAKLRLRYVPEIKFIIDTITDQQIGILKKIDKI